MTKDNLKGPYTFTIILNTESHKKPWTISFLDRESPNGITHWRCSEVDMDVAIRTESEHLITEPMVFAKKDEYGYCSIKRTKEEFA